MKKLLFSLIALFSTINAFAMSFTQAQERAIFLTDKMAYELNLTDDQYEAAYEINLDYFLSINSERDLFGDYWRYRNLDLSYILLDWQYNTYCNSLYFYRPIYWGDGYWHFRIYARYPHRSHFYFDRPAFYHTYRGAHAWHHNGGHSWYYGRTYGASHRTGGSGLGMRDHYHSSHPNHNAGIHHNNTRTGFNSSHNRGNNGSHYNDHGNHNVNSNDRGGNKFSSAAGNNRSNNFSSSTRSSSTRETATSSGQVSTDRNNSHSNFSSSSSSSSSRGSGFSGSSSRSSNSSFGSSSRSSGSSSSFGGGSSSRGGSSSGGASHGGSSRGGGRR